MFSHLERALGRKAFEGIVRQVAEALPSTGDRYCFARTCKSLWNACAPRAHVTVQEVNKGPHFSLRQLLFLLDESAVSFFDKEKIGTFVSVDQQGDNYSCEEWQTFLHAIVLRHRSLFDARELVQSIVAFDALEAAQCLPSFRYDSKTYRMCIHIFKSHRMLNLVYGSDVVYMDIHSIDLLTSIHWSWLCKDEHTLRSVRLVPSGERLSAFVRSMQYGWEWFQKLLDNIGRPDYVSTFLRFCASSFNYEGRLLKIVCDVLTPSQRLLLPLRFCKCERRDRHCCDEFDEPVQIFRKRMRI